MKRILVPTDFSETATIALNFAIESARILPAKITLLHSYEIYADYSADYLGINTELTYSILNESEIRLDRLRESIQEKHHLEVDTFLSTYPLNEAILKAIEEKNIDLIVMGTLGNSGTKEKIWGSRTSAVIGKTTVPVIAIPHDYKWKKPEKILFATNHFQDDSRILNSVFELAGLYMANVQVAVFTDTENDKTETYLHNKQHIAEYEDTLKARYYENTVSSVHLIGKDFSDTLQEYIKKNEIDMLIMVTYQAGFWKRLFNPSITRKMSYNTQIPLLAIPAH